MEPEAVLHLINEGRSVCLSNPFANFQNRGRYLFYSVLDNDFFIAVIAVSDISRKGLLVTILTREQHERDIGRELERSHRKRAVKSVLPSKEFTNWLAGNLPPVEDSVNQAGKYKNIRLNIEYWDEIDGRKALFISTPPISAEALRSAPVRKLLDNDVFASWLLERLNKKAIPMDKIIAFHLFSGIDEKTELVI